MMTAEEADTFLREGRVADLATVRPDGSPHVAPVWFHYDGEVVKVFARPTAVKLRNIANDPRVSISIATPGRPYQYVIVTGTAEVSEDEDVSELVQTMARNYMGEVDGPPYAEQILSRMTPFSVITVTPSKISGWSE
ncbi:MAG: PPOX class F420-dependent oxidoreductase [Chloroflexi bacterium]|nr:PPOX class F420-dependent oxidoreductase [Chloroflexota bacterium]